MVSTTHTDHSRSAPPTFGEMFRASPWLYLDGMVLISAIVVAGAFFYFYEDPRKWLWQSLGYGWIPVGLWAASVLFALRYRARTLVYHWRLWGVGAALVALCICGLSYFSPARGLLEEVSLAGRWGVALGGPSLLPVGLVKMLAITALVPLAFYPRSTVPVYSKGLSHFWQWLQLAAGYAYLGLCRVGVETRHGLGRLHDKAARGRAARAEAKRAANLGEYAGSPRAEDGHPGSETAPPAVATGYLKRAEVEKEPGAEADDDLPPWMQVPAASDDAEESNSGWRLPSTEMLAPPEPPGASEGEFKGMAKEVEQALADHGVRVEVTGITAGPRVVQFGLSPGWVARKAVSADGGERSRVKVQSIITREKDLALALKTPFLRIEAPVPGEALVGLEVPVPTPTKVHLRAVMETPRFHKLLSKGGLPIAMGQDTGGEPVALDLVALPHMLIAGATGSGKSVQINSIIASFLMTKTPDQLRLLMVDPKRVELTPFNGIPHLIQPVIVEAEEVTEALRGLSREMIRRYKQMEELGVRNIEVYNERSEGKMPFLVLIVDELADLMMVSGFEVEQNLVRLAQLGRAAGVHLLLATQRPSVNVVTGLLKANIPARCAFAVSGQVDSRVILDSVGAEKLMGKGDALILHKESPKPERMQGALVYDEEVEELVRFWTEQEGPPVAPINLESSEAEEGEASVDVDQMDKARDLAVRNPNLSTSVLERRLKVGGRRAEEILEALEEEGYLIPA